MWHGAINACGRTFLGIALLGVLALTFAGCSAGPLSIKPIGSGNNLAEAQTGADSR